MIERTIKPAIVAVGYNRPESLRRLLISIEHAQYPVDDVALVVSIDKSANQAEVLRTAEAVEWTHGSKTIRAFDKRQGLRSHVIQCGDLSQEYGAVIILEDDLIVSPSFYHYAYNAVNRYESDDRICGVALYRHAWNGYAALPFLPCKNEYDVFFGQFSVTWGQCWTDRQWSAFREWYAVHENRLPEKNDRLPKGILQWGDQSWGKYFISYMVEVDRYYVIPYTSMSTNFSEVGQHNDSVDCAHQVSLLEGIKKAYSFPSFEEGIKYDVFFERVFEKDTQIAGICADEVCVNLNGIKPSTLGKKYVLSTKQSEKGTLASFGLSLRPIEANVLLGIPGNDLFLNEAESCNLEVNVKDHGTSRASYELYGFYWSVLLKEGVRRFHFAVAAKLRRIRKRIIGR